LIEPEGWNTVEIYLNGFSTSLPEDVQVKALKQIPGLENVKIFRPGYAIEYDYFPPTQLQNNLESKYISNLFFAGQINGTTGYEEAACQGIMAGINAVRKINNEEKFILKRNEAYIGVLIDDLINKGTDEPYRMFTSRAEYRTLLRQDNADLRLTEKSYKIGLAKKNRIDSLDEKLNSIRLIDTILSETTIDPTDCKEYFNTIKTTQLNQKTKAKQIVLRPEVELKSFINNVKKLDSLSKFKELEIEQVETQIKYETYINKEIELVKKFEELENLTIPQNFDYNKVNALSTEARQKFNKIKPATLGQASRISGVNPSDIQILLVYMGR
jgi:tRNA uridine 5-carboxymethylaminomethyl modification enzyme